MPATKRKPAVIDADGHILEPRDLWEKRVPAKFRDRTLKVVWNEKAQLEQAMLEGVFIQKASVTNGIARQPMWRRADPRGWRWEDLPPAGLDPKARVAELDREGIDKAVLYPSIGLVLGGIQDTEHAIACCRAYNDWLAEFCSVAPDRLIGVGALPMQDPEASVGEARRAVEELGMRGFFVRPNAYNGRFMHDPVFDPLWDTVQGLGVPVGLHPSGTIDSLGAPQVYKPVWGDQFYYVGKPMHFLVDDVMGLVMMMGTGVLERFPKLKLIVLESGGGWLPHWLDKMDHWFEVVAASVKHLTLKPSEYVQRQVWVSFDPDEKTLPMVVQYAGDDRLIWASDYPHMDVMSPSVTEELYEHLEGMKKSSQIKILGKNAQEVYGI